MSYTSMMKRYDYLQDLAFRLSERSRIRRQISTRKSVQEGKPDRLADLLDEAAKEILKSSEHEYAAWENAMGEDL